MGRAPSFLEYEPIRTHVQQPVNVTVKGYRRGMIDRFSITPTLPNSLSFDERSGRITGTIEVGRGSVDEV